MGLKRDPFLISNYFKKFFSTIVQKIEGKIIKTNGHFSHFLTKPLKSIFFSPDEIQEIIKSLNNRKAIGPNRIPTKVLKVFGKTISIPL